MQLYPARGAVRQARVALPANHVAVLAARHGWPAGHVEADRTLHRRLQGLREEGGKKRGIRWSKTISLQHFFLGPMLEFVELGIMKPVLRTS